MNFPANRKIGFSCLVSIKLKLMQSYNLYGVKEKNYRPILSMNTYKNRIRLKIYI